jgi:VIT1/CCC1 family predicted Fe2+/Mn2+ transporter
MESISSAAFARNLAFGVQDAVVTTAGVLAASSAVPGLDMFRAGLVSVVASAFSMAIGSYQSERGAELATAENPADVHRGDMLGGAIVMFVSYLLTGLVVVAPWRFARGRVAAWASLVAAASLLAASAAFVSWNVPGAIVPNVAEMLALAALAVVGSSALSRLAP